MHDNSHIRLDIPVQYRAYDIRDDITDWRDCIVSEDGLFILAGITGSGIKHPLNTFKLRNTPLTTMREVDQWYKTKREELDQERDNLLKLGTERWKWLIYRYKSKTQLKKEVQAQQKPRGQKEYQIKS